MELKTTGRRVIDEFKWGIYVWRLPNNDFVADEHGNIMLIRCNGKNHDYCKQKITEAARHYGFPEGEPAFLSGLRPITDEEHEEQLAREKWGLTPDPLDIGAWQDEMRAAKYRND